MNDCKAPFLLTTEAEGTEKGFKLLYCVKYRRWKPNICLGIFVTFPTWKKNLIQASITSPSPSTIIFKDVYDGTSTSKRIKALPACIRLKNNFHVRLQGVWCAEFYISHRLNPTFRHIFLFASTVLLRVFLTSRQYHLLQRSRPMDLAGVPSNLKAYV